MSDHELSELLRDKSFECDEEMLEMVANMAEQLEAKNAKLKRMQEYVEEYHEEDFVMWCREQDALAEEE